jgi:hypothetical protein
MEPNVHCRVHKNSIGRQTSPDYRVHTLYFMIQYHIAESSNLRVGLSSNIFNIAVILDFVHRLKF